MPSELRTSDASHDTRAYDRATRTGNTDRAAEQLPQAELSDDELLELWGETADVLPFVRAAIAADRKLRAQTEDKP